MSKASARNEFLFLDSVRGVASVVVVASHLVMGFYPELHAPTQPPWVRIWYSGDFAVQLFFVLSGFVLSISFVRGGGLESIRSAAVRRYFRLVVPIAACVLLSYLLLRMGLYCNREAAIASGQTADSWLGRWFNFPASLPRAIDEGLYRALFAFNIDNTYNNVLWTMQAEFAGSFFVFGFLALFGGLRNRWLVYCVVGAVLIRQEMVSYFAFLAGMALCDAMAGRLPVRNRPLAGAALALTGILVGGTTHAWLQGWVEWTPKRLAIFNRPLGAVLLLYGVIRAGWVRAVLHSRPLVFLGHLSFPLYLAHLLVQMSLGCYVYLACRAAQYGPGSAFSAAAAATVAASLVIAWVGAITVEPLSIYLGRRVYTATFKPASTTPQDNAGATPCPPGASADTPNARTQGA